jgi:hypothetical protein
MRVVSIKFDQDPFAHNASVGRTVDTDFPYGVLLYAIRKYLKKYTFQISVCQLMFSSSVLDCCYCLAGTLLDIRICVEHPYGLRPIRLKHERVFTCQYLGTKPEAEMIICLMCMDFSFLIFFCRLHILVKFVWHIIKIILNNDSADFVFAFYTRSVIT